MDITNMKELYAELIKAAGRGFRNRSITNPAVDFTKRAKEIGRASCRERV